MDDLLLTLAKIKSKVWGVLPNFIFTPKIEQAMLEICQTQLAKALTDLKAEIEKLRGKNPYRKKGIGALEKVLLEKPALIYDKAIQDMKKLLEEK